MATVNIFDMADTWNNVATTYTAIKMNVTDTASASGSLLMDLQVGGASRFRIRKDGSLFLNSTTSRLYQYIGGARWVFTDQGNANCIWIQANDAPYALGLASNVNLTWASSTDVAASPALFLRRRANANLQLGAADAASPVAQTLGVQSVVAGTTNTAGANFTIAGSQGTGSGAGGSIIFQVAPAGSSGTAQNALSTALTIDGNGNVVASNSLRAALNIWGTSNSATFLLGSSADIVLARDAANTLAQRNGTNAQELRVYKTTTGTVYKALLGDNNLIKIAGEAFTDGAGANAGTLTNSPVTGNPTKWIPIDDNGTTRYIPAW